MRGPIVVPIPKERVGFRMYAEVAMRKEDELHRGKVGAREERLSMVTVPHKARFQCIPEGHQ